MADTNLQNYLLSTRRREEDQNITRRLQYANRILGRNINEGVDQELSRINIQRGSDNDNERNITRQAYIDLRERETAAAIAKAEENIEQARRFIEAERTAQTQAVEREDIQNKNGKNGKNGKKGGTKKMKKRTRVSKRKN